MWGKQKINGSLRGGALADEAILTEYNTCDAQTLAIFRAGDNCACGLRDCFVARKAVLLAMTLIHPPHLSLVLTLLQQLPYRFI